MKFEMKTFNFSITEEGKKYAVASADRAIGLKALYANEAPVQQFTHKGLAFS